MSTTVTANLPTHRALSASRRAAVLLVVSASLVAPLNLLIVRSLSVYDVLIFLAFCLLLRDGSLQWPPRRYLAASYVFVLAALLSSFRATYASEALTQVLQYLFVFFVLVPVVLTVVRTRRTAVACVVLLCVGTVGAMLHAYLFPQTQGAGRSLVFYSENPNRLGYPAVYVLPFVLALWQLSRSARGEVRLLVAVACGAAAYLSMWAVFASGSRSSLLGCAVAVFVFVVLRPDVTLVARLGRGVALVAVATVLGAGLLSSGQLPDTLNERVTRSVAADVDDRASLVGDREHLAQAGVLAFLDSPYLGTGLDNFRYVTTDYDLDATPQLPHNLWLQLLVQVGVFGTAAFAALLASWFAELMRSVRSAALPDRWLLWSIAAGMAGILTIFLFAPEMLDRHYWLIFALGLAAAAGATGATRPGGTT